MSKEKNREEFKQNLLDVLSDTEIKNQLREIFLDFHSGTPCTSPGAQTNSLPPSPADGVVLSRLQSELETLKRELSAKERTITELEQLRQDMEKNQQALEEKLRHSEGKIQEQRQAFFKAEEQSNNAKDQLQVKGRTITELERQLQNLGEKLQTQEERLRDREGQLQEKEQACAQLEMEKAAYAETCRRRELEIQQLTESQKHYQSIIKAYQVYQDLSQDCRDVLQGVFKIPTPEGILACGVQNRAIESLWQYTKRNYDKLSDGDIQNLDFLLDYFIGLLNLTYEEKTFARQEVRVGEEFDAELHSRDIEGRAAGPVSQVLLRGYVNLRTGKPVFKSFVKI